LPDADAHYGRTSSEEQAERRTIAFQKDYLTQRGRLDERRVAGGYWDDGVSGTLPLEARPDGRRLLADARAGRFRRVVVWNLTRLGRSLRVILDAYDQLQACGVEIVSATEPVDTSNPMGKFIFQLLASLAELDRATTLEKLTGGRDTRAREGRWTGGPIPFGLEEHPEDVGKDIAPRLVPSQRLVPQTGQTEEGLALELFRRVADGVTPTAEVNRLNALGVNSHTRYAGQDAPSRVSRWTLRRLWDLLHNPIYKGEHTLATSRTITAEDGTTTPVRIERAFPAIVDAALWAKAQATVSARARPRPAGGDALPYLLRGLVVCEDCGRGYCGTTHRPRKDRPPFTYYRCGGQLSAVEPDTTKRCGAKLLAADWLEDEVWRASRGIVDDRDTVLETLRRQVRERQGQSAGRGAEIAALEARLPGFERERDRIYALFRRPSGDVATELAAAERQLQEVSADEADVRSRIASLRTLDELARLGEVHLASAGALLAQLAETVAWVDANPDDPAVRARKREVTEQLVLAVRVATHGTGRQKTASIRLESAFAAAVALGREEAESWTDLYASSCTRPSGAPTPRECARR
jgi:DNA invertase Pin-like site-specific DNA recombinase